MEIQEREKPDYTGKVLIKVAYAGICGSDVSVYLGKHPRAAAPLIMGHEFSGTIEGIGEGVETDLKTGDRVVVVPYYFCGKCNACLNGNSHVCRTLRFFGVDRDGGMAEYVAVPVDRILKIPERMSMKMAAVVEPVAVVVHGLRMIKNNFYTSACVTGLGPMGLLTALMMKNAGVNRLFCVEANANRAEYARKLGLEVINPTETDATAYILEQTAGEGVEVLVEASGSPVVAKTMTDMTAVRGEILLLSVFKDFTPVDLRAVNFKEQVLVGTRVYTSLDFKDAIAYTYNNEKTIQAVVSHVFPIDKGQEVFQDITSGNTQAMKVLFEL